MLTTCSIFHFIVCLVSCTNLLSLASTDLKAPHDMLRRNADGDRFSRARPAQDSKHYLPWANLHHSLFTHATSLALQAFGSTHGWNLA
jgi:hypothetical protein